MQILEKARPGTLRQTSDFASSEICVSQSVFSGIRGAKRQRTIFYAQVGPVWIPHYTELVFWYPV
jgi:hypothetical protein